MAGPDNDSDADDDECEGVAYMFDAAAATERRSLALDHGAVYYYCLADDDASATHHISGHSAWPAALTLARRVAERWTPVNSVLELGCGCGIVGSRARRWAARASRSRIETGARSTWRGAAWRRTALRGARSTGAPGVSRQKSGSRSSSAAT